HHGGGGDGDGVGGRHHLVHIQVQPVCQVLHVVFALTGIDHVTGTADIQPYLGGSHSHTIVLLPVYIFSAQGRNRGEFYLYYNTKWRLEKALFVEKYKKHRGTGKNLLRTRSILAIISMARLPAIKRVM